jgi:UDP-N-acetylglucosamine--N-acetylmuramyl-(pentapeptide) pyrophosphoryl-undecaprenol N-acetylglucosamine transferase
MNIIFCGGGTLGPVTPLLATIEKLKEIEPKIIAVWVGTRHGVEREVVTRQGIEYHWLASAKLRRYFDWRSFLTPFIAAAGVFGAIWIVMKTQPKAVVSAGAFTQVPLIMVARLMGVPAIIHQQDVEIGLANRISSYDAKVVTSAFDTAVSQFGKQAVVVIGNPVRALIAKLAADPSLRAAARERALKRWNFDPLKPTILVLGGGTGALGLNERVVRTLDLFIAKTNVLNIVGRGKLVDAKPRQGYAAVEFLNEEMAEAYAVADLAISRAGLGTLTELGVMEIPTVLVPLPGHQEKNAAYLHKCNAALVVASDASDQVFTDTVFRLLADRERSLALSQNIANIFPVDAAEKLAKIVVDIKKQ